MKRNLGKYDRFIRMTIALLLVLGILSNYILGTWVIVASIAAVILFLTALFGHCPLYSLLKVSSLRK